MDDPGSSRPVHSFGSVIKSLFGVKEEVSDKDVTEQEIRTLLTEGQEKGTVQDSEAKLIANIFEFSDKQAQDIMTHRGDIVAIEEQTALNDAVQFLLDNNNSRFPVYRETIDHITGILHFRDAMQKHAAGGMGAVALNRIPGLLRQAHFVPETRNIDALFRSMQATHTQIVIVIDEYGQTAGLVSMEDILEEIVGNILDEYDEDEAYIEETANEDEYIIDGKTPLTELTERFGIVFENEEAETLNGLMIARLDRIPADDEQFETVIGGYTFRILSVANHMIASVLVRKPDDAGHKEETDVRTL